MIYVISKSTFGSYEVRDIQCNANWDYCPYSDYVLIPSNLVDGILATQGYCDITLSADGTTVASFTAREIPSVDEECCGINTVLSVNGARANREGEIRLPVNIADNSDWSNPVNQRGKTTYNSDEYTIDRWYTTANGATSVIVVNDGYITLSSDTSKYKGLNQRYADNTLVADKEYTVAIWLLDGSVLVNHAVIPQNNGSVDIKLGEKLQARLSHNSFGVILWNNADTITYKVKHVGVFEGVYTAETIPDYQPKGYGAELAECQRYFQTITSESYGVAHCVAGSNSILLSLPFKFPMRLKNPTVSGSLDVCTPNGWQGAQAPTGITESVSGFMVEIPKVAGYSTDAGHSVIVKGYVELSADL